MSEEIIWDICNPSWKKNFICKLNNKGKWRIESETENRLIFGKWIMTIEQINSNINAPTFADQRNFFTGLMEAEFRNDNFVYPNGTKRNPQKDNKIKMFQRVFDEVCERFKEDTQIGLNFYSNQFNDENNSD